MRLGVIKVNNPSIVHDVFLKIHSQGKRYILSTYLFPIYLF